MAGNPDTWSDHGSFLRLGLWQGPSGRVHLDAEATAPERSGTPLTRRDMAVGQNQWYLFGVGAPPILVYFSGDWDVHWGYGILTHGHIRWTLGKTWSCTWALELHMLHIGAAHVDWGCTWGLELHMGTGAVESKAQRAVASQLCCPNPGTSGQ